MKYITEALEVHETLNNKIFDGEILRADVRNALYNIANTFIEDIKQNNIPIEVVDIWLVGSNASYNYSDHSDVDLHIIVDTDNFDCTGLLNIVYNYVKSDFNKNHDITVKGIPVEVYIEDQNASAITNGIYSIVEDAWIKYPEKIDNIPEFNPEKSETYSNVKEWVLTALQSGDLSDVQDAINRLYLLRKSSLATDGEFGEGNLVFKEFRNDGSLEKLKERKRELVDKELTLEQLKEEKKVKVKKNAGNPEINNKMFNAMMNPMGSPSTNPTGPMAEDIEKEPDIIVDGDDVSIHYSHVMSNIDRKLYSFDYHIDKNELYETVLAGMSDVDWEEAQEHEDDDNDAFTYVLENLEEYANKYAEFVKDTYQKDAIYELDDLVDGKY